MDFDGPAPHGGGPPTPEAQLFALLKPLRGSLVRTSVVGAAGKAEKGVRVVSARRDADNGGVSLVIALVSERPTELELELCTRCGNATPAAGPVAADPVGKSSEWKKRPPGPWDSRELAVDTERGFAVRDFMALPGNVGNPAMRFAAGQGASTKQLRTYLSRLLFPMSSACGGEFFFV